MPPDPNSTTRRSARGRLYSVVTRFWPRIAAGFVVLVGLTELTLGGLTADSGLELYLTAWAATTGGLWFLSDRAEKALSGDARASVSAWLALGDLNKSLESIPKQFALLFDRVFGEALWSRRGFNRSCAASLCAVTVVTMTVLALGMDGGSLSAHPGEEAGLVAVAHILATMVTPAVLFNLGPDYLSLVETRAVIRWVGRSGRLGLALGIDLLGTAVVSAGGIILAVFLLSCVDAGVSRRVGMPIDWALLRAVPGDVIRALVGRPPSLEGLLRDPAIAVMMRISFVSAFFTSVWLWLYASAVLFARSLVRVGGGVGFLLRLTDVEQAPFRSLGFVTVLLASALFALGLPLVLF